MIKMAELKPDQKQDQKPEFRHIVRIANTDLDGKKQILIALRKIKGVSFMYANFCLYKSNIDIHQKTGEMTDEQIKKLDEVVTKPLQHQIPNWLVNRRFDPETGNTSHIITNDLRFILDNDIKMMKKVKSYKGLRHSWGQPVRGQRTKSNFRKNKGKANLGVTKKKAAAPSGDKKK
jgi:small subunit ribosomal protein S13